MPMHRVAEGDDLWTLADRFYGDGSAWPLIYEANRGILPNETAPLVPGQLLIIPINAEDAADWADLTDDRYGADRGFKPRSRVDFGNNPDEAIQRLGYFEQDHPRRVMMRDLAIRFGSVAVFAIIAVVVLQFCNRTPF